MIIGKNISTKKDVIIDINGNTRSSKKIYDKETNWLDKANNEETIKGHFNALRFAYIKARLPDEYKERCQEAIDGLIAERKIEKMPFRQILYLPTSDKKIKDRIIHKLKNYRVYFDSPDISALSVSVAITLFIFSIAQIVKDANLFSTIVQLLIVSLFIGMMTYILLSLWIRYNGDVKERVSAFWNDNGKWTTIIGIITIGSILASLISTNALTIWGIIVGAALAIYFGRGAIDKNKKEKIEFVDYLQMPKNI